MKKLVLLALVAFTYLAAHASQIITPVPGCNPCDWVR